MDAVALDTKEIYEPPSQLNFQLYLSQPCSGGFKKGYFGLVESSVSHFSSSAIDVCVKQMFFTNSFNQEVLYGSTDQMSRLGMELKCLCWGQALISLVFAYVVSVRARKPAGWKPRLNLPNVRFVRAGLAIEQGQVDPSKGKVYMIEEKIEGEFKKYIHNGNATIPKGILRSEATLSLAQFLSFSQHVQYIKTKKAAFISDYQGLCLLTFAINFELIINLRGASESHG
jgi:hypothetical protein